jgi:hypothetical protein
MCNKKSLPFSIINIITFYYSTGEGASNSDFGKIQGLVWPQQGILATLFHFGRIFVS